jgi:hypothetical protein
MCGFYRDGVVIGCKPPQSHTVEGRPESCRRNSSISGKVDRHGLAR